MYVGGTLRNKVLTLLTMLSLQNSLVIDFLVLQSQQNESALTDHLDQQHHLGARVHQHHKTLVKSPSGKGARQLVLDVQELHS